MNSSSDTKNHNRQSTLILLMDVALSLIASVASILIIRWLIHPVTRFTAYMLVWLAAATLCSLVGCLLFRTHKMVIRYSSYKSIYKLFLAILLKEALLALAMWFQLFHFVDRNTEIMLLMTDMFTSMITLVVARVFIIALIDNAGNDIGLEVSQVAVMIYGISSRSVALMVRLESGKDYRILGFLTRDKSMAGKLVHDKPVYYFEGSDNISKFKISMGLQGILFSSDSDAQSEQDGLVKLCLQHSLHMLVTPNVEETDFGGLSQHAIKQVVDNDYIPDGMSSFGRVCKRLVDLFLSSIALIIFAIPMLICFIAIKLDDGGPAIYKQERIGRFGRPFFIYKFRSMRLDAEKFGPALYSGDDDPRLTKVGKFLRVHHLDEMPQLYNVFRGDMAFVGYRPERKFFIDQIMKEDPRYYYLYQIRPGVTSYATLRNGYTDNMEKMLRRLEYDLYYLRHRSWWFDIKVLWQTFTSIIFGKKF